MGMAKIKHTRTSKKGLVFKAGNRTIAQLLDLRNEEIDLNKKEDIEELYSCFNDIQNDYVLVNCNFRVLHEFFYMKALKVDKTLKIDYFTVKEMLEQMSSFFKGSKIEREGKPDFFNFKIRITKQKGEINE